MKKSLVLMLAITISSFNFIGCKSKNQTLDLSEIRNISNLAIQEAVYNNVAKVEKGKGGFAKCSRKMWIEYSGKAKIGIDSQKIKIEVDKENKNIIKIKLPEVEILSTKIDEASLTKDSFTISKDGIRKNRITAKDQTHAIDEAQKNMKETAENDVYLKQKSKDNCKKIMNSYVEQIAEISRVPYQIEWVE